jgi:hypothetical protein
MIIPHIPIIRRKNALQKKYISEKCPHIAPVKSLKMKLLYYGYKTNLFHKASQGKTNNRAAIF